MPSKYAPKPDKISSRVIRFFRVLLEKSDKDEDDINEEHRRFKSIYSSVINHAMNKKGQDRRKAHKYALRVYISQAPKWSGNLLKKCSKNV
jgi:hypothetical protein